MRFPLLLLLMTFSVFGAVDAKTEKTITGILSKWKVKVLDIRDLGSLYEVDVLGAPGIIYFTKDLRYMLMGGLFDPKTGKNLTYERLKQLEVKYEKTFNRNIIGK